MKIYVVRHGKANDKTVDPERHLSEAGKNETRKVALHLKKTGIEPLKVIHSPKMRAIETAQLIDREINTKEGTEEVEDLKPNSDPSIWFRKIKEKGEDIMLVGHLPYVDNFLEAAFMGKYKNSIKFLPTTVVCLEIDGDECRILWTVNPYSV